MDPSTGLDPGLTGRGDHHVVGLAVESAAGHHHGVGSEVAERFGALQHGLRARQRRAGQQLGLAPVRRDHPGQPEQPSAIGLLHLAGYERHSLAVHHHRVDHRRGQDAALDPVRHQLDHLAPAQQPGLGAGDPQLGRHRVDLAGHQAGLDRLHCGDRGQ